MDGQDKNRPGLSRIRIQMQDISQEQNAENVLTVSRLSDESVRPRLLQGHSTEFVQYHCFPK